MTETTATPEMGTEGLSINQASSQIEALLYPPKEDKPKAEGIQQEEPAIEEEEQEEKPEDQSDDVEDDEQEEDDQEDGAEPKYEVTLPGGEKAEVPLSELLKGYSRESDYTKKTTALAEQRKQLSTEIEAKAAEAEAQLRGQYGNKLNELEKLLSGEPDVDWATLERDNPAEFLRLKVKEMDRKEALEITRKEQNRIQTEEQHKRQAQYQEYLESNLEALVEKAPEFRDPAKGPKLFSDVNTYLKGAGYSPEEINNLADHRAILIVRDALKYRDIQNKAKSVSEKKVTHVPQVQKPGTPRDTSPKQDQIKARRNQLARTGSVKDAASLIEQFL